MSACILANRTETRSGSRISMSKRRMLEELLSFKVGIESEVSRRCLLFISNLVRETLVSGPLLLDPQLRQDNKS